MVNSLAKTATRKLLPDSKRNLAEIAVFFISVIAALLVYGIFIILIGGNLLEAYATILKVSLGSQIGWAQTLNKWTPLLLGSIAVAIGNRSGVVNIGVDGQIFIGGTVATGVAFSLAGFDAPLYVLAPVALLAGFIGGGMYSGIAGFLKARWGVNEIFVTVMMNFIAINIAEYFASGPWNDIMAGDAITVAIPGSTFLPLLFVRGGGHVGFIIALLVVFLVYFLLEKTVLGYSIKAVGTNPAAAKAAGINASFIMFLGLSLSGAIAGLAGAIEVTGIHHRLLRGLSPNFGIMSIILAAIGKNNPLGIILSSFFFAVLFVGSDSLQRSIGVPASAVIAFQGMMFLFILLGRALLERSNYLK